jgi:hypothetical protein
MASASEGKYAGEFVAASIPGASSITNDRVVVLSGQSLVPGDVVGKVTTSGVGRVSVPTVVGTGNGTCTLAPQDRRAGRELRRDLHHGRDARRRLHRRRP